MALADITGRTYGPIRYRLGREKVADYIEATADDPDRWAREVPPSFSGALLFSVAPALLADPDLATHRHGVIHGDQAFQWHRPLEYGSDVTVVGEVTKLRERGGVAFLGFGIEVGDDDGTLIEGQSTFLLSGESAAAGTHAEEDEPGPDEASRGDLTGTVITRAATRRDLVKYAGASRDFNPVHWDHTTAVGAGLPGVVVHGLLQSAWALQAVVPPGVARPVVHARYRYRAPLRPGVSVGAFVEEIDEFQRDVVIGDGITDYLAARISVAP